MRRCKYLNKVIEQDHPTVKTSLACTNDAAHFRARGGYCSNRNVRMINKGESDGWPSDAVGQALLRPASFASPPETQAHLFPPASTIHRQLGNFSTEPSSEVLMQTGLHVLNYDARCARAEPSRVPIRTSGPSALPCFSRSVRPDAAGQTARPAPLP